MNEVQEYRKPNSLGKVVSFLMIGTFGGAMILLIVSLILLVKTVSMSKEIQQNNDATMTSFVNAQNQIEAEIEITRREVDSALTEFRTGVDTANEKAKEVENNTLVPEEPKIEVVIDEDTVRKIVAEYLSERQQESVVSNNAASTSNTLDKAIEQETEMMLKIMELLVGGMYE